MTLSSLHRRVRRSECETFGSFCPCRHTNQWAGVWAEILTAIEQRDGRAVAQARCVRCEGLVPRPPRAEVQALIAKIRQATEKEVAEGKHRLDG